MFQKLLDGHCRVLHLTHQSFFTLLGASQLLAKTFDLLREAVDLPLGALDGAHFLLPMVLANLLAHRLVLAFQALLSRQNVDFGAGLLIDGLQSRHFGPKIVEFALQPPEQGRKLEGSTQNTHDPPSSAVGECLSGRSALPSSPSVLIGREEDGRYLASGRLEFDEDEEEVGCSGLTFRSSGTGGGTGAGTPTGGRTGDGRAGDSTSIGCGASFRLITTQVS